MPYEHGVTMENRWQSVDEIAEYLGVSKDTIYSWVSGKGMPGHKVGRFWKFKQDEIDEWVRAGGAAIGFSREGGDQR
jgi:excisionase family DNA binding protein